MGTPPHQIKPAHASRGDVKSPPWLPQPDRRYLVSYPKSMFTSDGRGWPVSSAGDHRVANTCARSWGVSLTPAGYDTSAV